MDGSTNDLKASLCYVFRGHEVGVSALARLEQTLISGDEKGNLHFWSLVNFRLIAKWTDISGSRIQSLKIVKLPIKGILKNVLVCQTRDNGVKLILCDDLSSAEPANLIIQQFLTYNSLFARGDSLTAIDDTAILAYPSNVASNMIAVRYVGPEAQILSAGNASKHGHDEKDRLATVFDIKLLPHPKDKNSHLVFCGYEDGSLVIFCANSKLTKTIEELNVTGLKLDVIKNIDLGFKDFVSAFDVQLISNELIAVCGSPQKELVICTLPDDLTSEKVSKLALQKRGTSTVAIRSNSDLVAMADWSGMIRLYSMISKNLKASLQHSNRMNFIMFMDKCAADETDTVCGYWMCCASLDGTINLYEIR